MAIEVFHQRNGLGEGAPSRLVRGALTIGALTLAATACGGSRQPVAEATGGDTPPIAITTPATTLPTLEEVPPTTAPATTAPATTAPATTRPTTSTTTAPTSTTPALPDTEPIAPPADVHADEPVIEVGTIAIPKIGVDMTMYEGIRLTTLDYGPGHWPGSALPGEIGNVVVAGHRTSKHHVFRDVDQLVAGDEIIFRDATGEHVYLVDRVEIVEPSAIWIVDPTATPTATLFACHPPGSTAAAHRRLRRPRRLMSDRLDADGPHARRPRSHCCGRRAARGALDAAVGVLAARVRRRRAVRDRARRRADAPPTRLVRASPSGRVAVLGMGWMWFLTAPGYIVAGAAVRRAARRRGDAQRRRVRGG